MADQRIAVPELRRALRTGRPEFAAKLANKKITHFRRFHGYDYSRGAAVFVTFGLEPRRPLLGAVAGEHMVLSPAGEAVFAELRRENADCPGIDLRAAVVMPDHVHLRLQILPGLDKPLHELGRFIYNVKFRSQRAARAGGVEIAWQRNYHDRICYSREIIDLVDKYIANNPLKWTLMHGNPPPLRVHEPLDSPLLPSEEWWTGVGNEAMVQPGAKLAAVRLSRTIQAAEFPAVLTRLRTAVERGFALMGTWISPCERAVFTQLAAAGAPLVRAVPDPLAMVYRPKEDEPGLFAGRRYLLLSRVAAQGGRGAAWHGINDALADIALAGDGTSLYVHRVQGELELRWDFESARAVSARAAPGTQDGGRVL
ncbi:MAG: transposase [Kiritimatiellae bacterium]|nr:transposase [Kiritimatiellia bacterium]